MVPEERKLVTVVFADVVGSTSLGDDLDPEDVRAVMARYYEHARHTVEQHGGTLEKFIGDAAMAVFGLPHAHGDDAERGLATSLALLKAVGEDSDLAGVNLRIGVNTGGVVATNNPSSGDFLVTGDAVNVAARLQQVALDGCGSILQLSGDTKTMIATTQRRIAAPVSSEMEKGDAINMLAWTYATSAEFDASIDLMERTLAELRVGHWREPYCHGVSWAVQAACLCGRWDAVDRLLPALREGWDGLKRDAGHGFLLPGFLRVYMLHSLAAIIP